MNKTDYTLVECLQKVDRKKLPNKAEKGSYWSKAILRVLKSDGNEYYVIQGTSAQGNLCIKNDFEDTYAIVSIVETYPIGTFEPIVLGKNIDVAEREDKIKMLKFVNGMSENWVPEQRELEKLTDDELTDYCIRLIRLRDYAHETCKEAIRETNDKIKKEEEAVEKKPVKKTAKKEPVKKTTKKQPTTKNKSNGKSKKAEE